MQHRWSIDPVLHAAWSSDVSFNYGDMLLFPQFLITLIPYLARCSLQSDLDLNRGAAIDLHCSNN